MSAAPAVVIRPAVREDTGRILAFIRELAEYEKLAHEAVADEAGLAQQLFGPTPRAEVLIAEVDGEAAGFAPVSYTHLDVYKRQVLTLCQYDF